MATLTKKKNTAKKAKSTTAGKSTGAKRTAKSKTTKSPTKKGKTTVKKVASQKATAKKHGIKKSTPKKNAKSRTAVKKNTTGKTKTTKKEMAAVVETVITAVAPTDEYTEDFACLKEVLIDTAEPQVAETTSQALPQDDTTPKEEPVSEDIAVTETAVSTGPETEETVTVEDEVEAVKKASEKQETEQSDSTDELQLVCFSINGEEYGVDIYRVQEINRVVEVTSIPEAPYYVKGIINLRGNVIPILDLRLRLGFPTQEKDKDTRIIVLDHNDRLIGLTVDSVTKVLRVSKSTLEDLPSQASTTGADFLEGIIRLEDRLILVIDCKKIVEL